MWALRFGSYSISATVPGTPGLLRLKSMIRYIRLCPPPRRRLVMRPCALRPPLFLMGASRLFSGSARVISSRSVIARKRRPGVTGLNFLIGMSDPLVDVDPLALDELHDGLLVAGAPTEAAPDATPLAAVVQRVHRGDLHAEETLHRVADLDLVRILRHDERVRVLVLA